MSIFKPPFGDQKLITFELTTNANFTNQILKRKWKRYSSSKLNYLISHQNWHIRKDSVQSYWNKFESKLVKIVDQLAPF